MRKSLTYKILAAVMALSAVNVFVPHNMLAYNITSDNTTISTGTINENIYGNGHSFTIDGDAVIYGYVYGVGNGNYDKDASGGNVTINGNAEVTYAVYGGRSDRSAHHNTVNISDGSVTGNVYGGNSGSGQAHHNIVNISGGTVLDKVRGGYSHNGEAYDNTVNISGDSVLGKVYGGWSTNSSAHHNTVNISGVVNVTEDYSGIYGGTSSNGSAYDNTVYISGGVVNVTEDYSGIYGGWSSTGRAYDNTVYISGGSVSGDVYGGYVALGIANNNEVVISGSAVIENAKLYGRNDEASGTGNTLTIDGWNGSTQSVKNFSDINFNNVNWKNGETVLTITNGSKGNLTNTNINLNSIASGSSIKAGDKMTFISSNTNLSDEVNYNINDTFTAGVALEGTGTTSVDTKPVRLPRRS